MEYDEIDAYQETIKSILGGGKAKIINEKTGESIEVPPEVLEEILEKVKTAWLKSMLYGW